MLRKWSVVLALLSVMLLPLAVQAQGEKQPPTVVLRVQSFDAVLTNLKVLTKAVGQEQIGKQIDAEIKKKIGPGGLEGVDTKKPVGLYANLSGELTDATGILMVPIKDQQKFLKLLENRNYPAKKKGDVYVIDQTDVPVDVGFRFAHGYAYITAVNLDILKKETNLLTPAQVFPKDSKALLSGVIRMDQIPEAFKMMALEKIDEELKKAKEKAQDDGKTPAQKKLNGQLIDTLGEQVKDFVRGAAEISGEFTIDPMTRQISFEYSVDAIKNSQLKKTFESMGKHTSIFGALATKKADAVESFHLVLPADLKKAFNNAMEEGIKQAVQEEPDADKKAAAKKFFEAVKPTLHSGDFDMAAYVQTHKDGQITAVGAVKVKDGAKLEGTLSELYKGLPQSEKDKFKLDVDKAGQVSIHQINIQGYLQPQDKKYLGDGPMFVAIRSDAAFIAVGKNALNSIKETLELPVTPGKKLLYYDIKLGPILKLVLQKDHEKAAADKAFAKDPGQVRIIVESGQKFEIKVQADLSILEFGMILLQKNKEVLFKNVD
jgi:hypothetical protein